MFQALLLQLLVNFFKDWPFLLGRCMWSANLKAVKGSM